MVKTYQNTNTIVLEGEDVFFVPTGTFHISPSSSGYTLKVAVDKAHEPDDVKAIDPGGSASVEGFTPGLIWKLEGNTDVITIKY